MTGPAHKGSHTKMFIVALFIGKTSWKHLSAHKQGTVKYTRVCAAVPKDGREMLQTPMASGLAVPLLETYPTDLPVDSKVFLHKAVCCHVQGQKLASGPVSISKELVPFVRGHTTLAEKAGAPHAPTWGQRGEAREAQGPRVQSACHYVQPAHCGQRH